MKRAPHLKEKKILSMSGLLKVVRQTFSHINNLTKKSHRDRKINSVDCLMSALAMFSLKSPSLYGEGCVLFLKYILLNHGHISLKQ